MLKLLLTFRIVKIVLIKSPEFSSKISENPDCPSNSIYNLILSFILNLYPIPKAKPKSVLLNLSLILSLLH